MRAREASGINGSNDEDMNNMELSDDEDLLPDQPSHSIQHMLNS